MKRISTAVLAVALMGGATGAIVAMPALAKDKKEDAKPAPTGPQVSKEFFAVFDKGRKALAANDIAGTFAAANEAEPLAKSDDEKYYLALLRYSAAQKQVEASAAASNGSADPTPMIAPLEAIIANPKTPADKRPDFEFDRGTMAYNAKDFALAVKMFSAAQQHGSTQKLLPLYLAKAKVSSGDVPGGLADLGKLADSGTQDEDIYKWGVQTSAQRGLKPETTAWLKRWMTAYPTAKTWRDALYYYGLSGGSINKLVKRERVDLYRLLRQVNALADQAVYADYGQNVMDIGLPDETKAIILEGRTKGKIPAGDSLTTSLLASANTQITAEGSFTALEAKATASPTGALSAQTGDAYLGRGEYAKAATLYKQALTKGGVAADEVNTHLGIALALSGDKEGARAAFGAVAPAGNRGDIAAFWLLWLDHPPTS